MRVMPDWTAKVPQSRTASQSSSPLKRSVAVAHSRPAFWTANVLRDDPLSESRSSAGK